MSGIFKTNQGKYSPFLKTFSIFLISCFLFQEIAFANPDVFKINLEGKTDTENSKAWAKKVLPAIPESIATIEDACRISGSDKTIILFQDAHTNNSGQLNTAKTLDLIFKKDPIKYIFLEAGSGDESLSFLRKYASESKRKEVAKSFMVQGKLQGTEYLDLTSGHDLVLWGVEDLNLYAQSVAIYRAVVEEREKFEDYLNRIESTIETLKPKIYNSFLSAFDTEFQKFQKNRLSLTDYFEVLTLQAAQRAISLENYPHLKTLKKLKEIESKIDFEKANEEERVAVASLPLEVQKELIAAQASKISAAEKQSEKAFFALLEEKVGTDGRYPELSKYFRYLKEAATFDPKAVLEEQKALEKDVFKALTRNEDEAGLIRASKNLGALKKLFNLTLTPDEFGEYQKDKQDYDINRLTGFLNKKIMDLKAHYERAIFLEPGYADVVKRCESFYSLTYERDRKFVENLIWKMSAENQEKAVLITGGYHTPNLKYLLKDRGLSYICVIPQVFQETNQKRYEELLLKQKIDRVASNHFGAALHTNMLNRILEQGRSGVPYDAELAGALTDSVQGGRLALQEMKEKEDGLGSYDENPTDLGGARLAASPEHKKQYRELPGDFRSIAGSIEHSIKSLDKVSEILGTLLADESTGFHSVQDQLRHYAQALRAKADELERLPYDQFMAQSRSADEVLGELAQIPSQIQELMDFMDQSAENLRGIDNYQDLVNARGTLAYESLPRFRAANTRLRSIVEGLDIFEPPQANEQSLKILEQYFMAWIQRGLMRQIPKYPFVMFNDVGQITSIDEAIPRNENHFRIAVVQRGAGLIQVQPFYQDGTDWLPASFIGMQGLENLERQIRHAFQSFNEKLTQVKSDRDRMRRAVADAVVEWLNKANEFTQRKMTAPQTINMRRRVIENLNDSLIEHLIAYAEQPILQPSQVSGEDGSTLVRLVRGQREGLLDWGRSLSIPEAQNALYEAVIQYSGGARLAGQKPQRPNVWGRLIADRETQEAVDNFAMSPVGLARQAFEALRASGQMEEVLDQLFVRQNPSYSIPVDLSVREGVQIDTVAVGRELSGLLQELWASRQIQNQSPNGARLASWDEGGRYASFLNAQQTQWRQEGTDKEIQAARDTYDALKYDLDKMISQRGRAGHSIEAEQLLTVKVTNASKRLSRIQRHGARLAEWHLGTPSGVKEQALKQLALKLSDEMQKPVNAIRNQIGQLTYGSTRSGWRNWTRRKTLREIQRQLNQLTDIVQHYANKPGVFIEESVLSHSVLQGRYIAVSSAGVPDYAREGGFTGLYSLSEKMSREMNSAFRHRTLEGGHITTLMNHFRNLERLTGFLKIYATTSEPVPFYTSGPSTDPRQWDIVLGVSDETWSQFVERGVIADLTDFNRGARLAMDRRTAIKVAAIGAAAAGLVGSVAYFTSRPKKAIEMQPQETLEDLMQIVIDPQAPLTKRSEAAHRIGKSKDLRAVAFLVDSIKEINAIGKGVPEFEAWRDQTKTAQLVNAACAVGLVELIQSLQAPALRAYLQRAGSATEEVFDPGREAFLSVFEKDLKFPITDILLEVSSGPNTGERRLALKALYLNNPGAWVDWMIADYGRKFGATASFRDLMDSEFFFDKFVDGLMRLNNPSLRLLRDQFLPKIEDAAALEKGLKFLIGVIDESMEDPDKRWLLMWHAGSAIIKLLPVHRFSGAVEALDRLSKAKVNFPRSETLLEEEVHYRAGENFLTFPIHARQILADEDAYQKAISSGNFQDYVFNCVEQFEDTKWNEFSKDRTALDRFADDWLRQYAKVPFYYFRINLLFITSYGYHNWKKNGPYSSTAGARMAVYNVTRVNLETQLMEIFSTLAGEVRDVQGTDQRSSAWVELFFNDKYVGRAQFDSAEIARDKNLENAKLLLSKLQKKLDQHQKFKILINAQRTVTVVGIDGARLAYANSALVKAADDYWTSLGGEDPSIAITYRMRALEAFDQELAKMTDVESLELTLQAMARQKAQRANAETFGVGLENKIQAKIDFLTQTKAALAVVDSLAESKEALTPSPFELLDAPGDLMSGEGRALAAQHEQALTVMMLHLADIHSEADLAHPLAVSLISENPSFFKIEKEATRNDARVRLLMLTGENEYTTVTEIPSFKQALAKFRQVSAAQQKQAYALGINLLLAMAAEQTDAAVTTVRSRASLEHALPTGSLAQIQDEIVFASQAQILVEAFLRIRRLSEFNKDAFYLTGEFNEIQRSILETLIKKNNLVSTVYLGEPRGKSVIVRYRDTARMNEAPTNQKNEIQFPVTGLEKDQVLGWYAAIRLAGSIGEVYAAHFADGEIRFAEVSPEDLPEAAFTFRNTHGVEHLADRSIWKAVSEGNVSLEDFRKASFYLPLQKIAIEVLVQGARMALRAVGGSA